MDGFRFPCDPSANPAACVTGPTYRFTVLNDKVLRYEWAEDGCFEDRASTFAIWRNFPPPNFRIEDKGHKIELITPEFRLFYDKKELSSNGFVVTFSANLATAVYGAEWRYGQSSAYKNLGGTARTLDKVDGRCDMGLGILSRRGYANLDDSESMLFDQDGLFTPRRPGKRVDGYIFAYGIDYKGAMEAFYAISGRQPSIPRWCLGNWWSRYHAYNHTEYLALIDRFKENDIPLSVAVVDMDWHWVNESFVPHTGWTGYSWNKNLFPSPEKFTQALAERDLKITLNDHPHSGVHQHEDVYEELAERLGHDTSNRDPIIFEPTSHEFMLAFFGLVHRRLEEIGCDFWWIDWQQGTTTDVPGLDPLWLLNHLQFLDTKQAKPHSPPIIFSRYAGPGSHRYPVGFSRDTIATWASLRFQPEFTATASNIGFGWWSHDIGGHLPGERDDECTTRWIQYGVFSPVLRLHSTTSRWMSKERWLYRAEHTTAMREALQLRHRLVPYIYSCSNMPESTLPLVQPMYWEYPIREIAYRYPNQYTFGPSLVVSPIVDPRYSRTDLAKAQVWISPQRHVDIFTGTVYDGDRELDMCRTLHSIPVLAPEGSIVPLDRHVAPANGCKNPDAYEVIIVVGKDGRFDIIEDSQDDRGNHTEAERRSLCVVYDQAAGQLMLSSSSGKAWSFRFISTHIEPSLIEVRINNKIVAEASCNNGGRDTIVSLPAGLPSTANIFINLGTTPQLAVCDDVETISQLLLDFQTTFAMKDTIWEIVHAEQPTTVKASRLLSLVIDKVFIGPIMELLLADSRS